MASSPFSLSSCFFFFFSLHLFVLVHFFSPSFLFLFLFNFYSFSFLYFTSNSSYLQQECLTFFLLSLLLFTHPFCLSAKVKLQQLGFFSLTSSSCLMHFQYLSRCFFIIFLLVSTDSKYLKTLGMRTYFISTGN